MRKLMLFLSLVFVTMLVISGCKTGSGPNFTSASQQQFVWYNDAAQMDADTPGMWDHKFATIYEDSTFHYWDGAAQSWVAMATDSSVFATQNDIDSIQEEVSIVVANGTEALTVGAFKNGIAVGIGPKLDGMNLISATAIVDDKGVTGTTDIQIVRKRGGVDTDMLSTVITLGDEWFASDGVIDAANDDVATGDAITFDIDVIHSGTAPNGLYLVLVFQAP